jgi:hypothetical protein
VAGAVIGEGLGLTALMDRDIAMKVPESDGRIARLECGMKAFDYGTDLCFLRGIRLLSVDR